MKGIIKTMEKVTTKIIARQAIVNNASLPNDSRGRIIF
jgi:hypothetical protein